MIREMYAEIQKQTDKHSVSELCEIYGVSRSGYYKWLKRAEQLNRYPRCRACVVQRRLQRGMAADGTGNDAEHTGAVLRRVFQMAFIVHEILPS